MLSSVACGLSRFSICEPPAVPCVTLTGLRWPHIRVSPFAGDDPRFQSAQPYLIPCYVELKNNMGAAQLCRARRGFLLRKEGHCNGRQAGFNVAFGACCCVCSFVVWRGGLAPRVLIFTLCLTCLAAFFQNRQHKNRNRKYHRKFYNNGTATGCRTFSQHGEALRLSEHRSF